MLFPAQGVGVDIEVPIIADLRHRFIMDSMAMFVQKDGCAFEQVSSDPSSPLQQPSPCFQPAAACKTDCYFAHTSDTLSLPAHLDGVFSHTGDLSVLRTIALLTQKLCSHTGDASLLLTMQLIMEEEQGNPDYIFLFDLTSPEHLYYRWGWPQPG